MLLGPEAQRRSGRGAQVRGAPKNAPYAQEGPGADETKKMTSYGYYGAEGEQPGGGPPRERCPEAEACRHGGQRAPCRRGSGDRDQGAV